MDALKNAAAASVEGLMAEMPTEIGGDAVKNDELNTNSVLGEEVVSAVQSGNPDAAYSAIEACVRRILKDR